MNLFSVPGLTGGTLDPTVNAFLHTVNTAITGTPNGLIAPGITPLQGAINQNTDLNTVNYLFLPPANRVEHNPAARVDLNLSNKHKLTATYTFQKVNSVPDELNSEEVRFPGFPVAGNQTSFRNPGIGHVADDAHQELGERVELWFPVVAGVLSGWASRPPGPRANWATDLDPVSRRQHADRHLRGWPEQRPVA